MQVHTILIKNTKLQVGNNHDHITFSYETNIFSNVQNKYIFKGVVSN
ncbi:hypothetical protein Leryth_021385 [Lithospermum erythrorhizon]|nr:hypothetical protein Leryth_021385 [Lithospermum erythrorhizon]